MLVIHVALSLIGIVSGVIVLAAMAGGRKLDLLTLIFLVTTVLTSATGFPLDPPGIDPPRIIGIISLVVLGIALHALYVFKLRGAWRWIYVVTATVALWFNSFVAVVQSFQKLSFLKPLAPTQSEPPFLAAQLIVLAILAILGFLALKKFRPANL